MPFMFSVFYIYKNHEKHFKVELMLSTICNLNILSTHIYTSVITSLRLLLVPKMD